jgi:ABC transporter with metal-binding/Fe-S-binding domain ATP-binding protein
MKEDRWISLFSGGKDSNWALCQALESGFNVEYLLTVHPPTGSYMYHVPATRVVSLVAESIGIELIEIEPEFEIPGDVDSGEQGDKEIKCIKNSLMEIADEINLKGIVTGAVESEYQRSRIQKMCDELGIVLYAPLWKSDPLAMINKMVESGFEIMIVSVAADGMEESWLGRYIDNKAIVELKTINEKYGVHILGEGGEYETLVTNGPHMNRGVGIEYDVFWEQNWGEIRVKNAWLN